MEYAIGAANRAGVKKLAMVNCHVHHDPDRTDSALDELAKIYW